MEEKMFEIKYRINETFVMDNNGLDDSDVLGFLELMVNGHSYGYYHNKPFSENDCLWVWLSHWFIDLLEMCQELCHSDYAAISDISSYCAWIEFKKVQDMVYVSIIRSNENDSYIIPWPPTTINELENKEPCENSYETSIIRSDEGSTTLRLVPFDYFEYGEWHNEAVDFSNLRSEIISKASQYLCELHNIDKKWLSDKNIIRIEALILSALSTNM